ncbi:MAG: hypothetical protein V3U75_10365 [Methylococcaceae bacterium]
MNYSNNNKRQIKFLLFLLTLTVSSVQAVSFVDLRHLNYLERSWGTISGLAYNAETDQFYLGQSFDKPSLKALILTIDSNGNKLNQWDLVNLVPHTAPLRPFANNPVFRPVIRSITYGVSSNHLFINGQYIKSTKDSQEFTRDLGRDKHIFETSIDGSTLFNDIATESLNDVSATGRRLNTFVSESRIWKVDGQHETVSQSTKTNQFIDSFDVSGLFRGFPKPRALTASFRGGLFIAGDKNRVVEVDLDGNPLRYISTRSILDGSSKGIIVSGDRIVVGISSDLSSNRLFVLLDNHVIVILTESDLTAMEAPFPELPPVSPSALPLCSIGADPQTIQAGERVPLWWWSNRNHHRKVIDHGVGLVTDQEGYKWIYPTETTTYTMTVETFLGHRSTCQTTIVVEGETTPNPPVCDIGANLQTINAGEGVPLWWWTQDIEKPPLINNGVGSVSVLEGYKWVYPTETTTYTMNVEDEGGNQGNCETTVIVESDGQAAPKLPSCDIGTDPQTIRAGEGVPLWWWFQGEDVIATIDNSMGWRGDFQGNEWIHPTETTTYTMTVEDGGGKKGTCETTVVVEGEADPATLPFCEVSARYQPSVHSPLSLQYSMSDPVEGGYFLVNNRFAIGISSHDFDQSNGFVRIDPLVPVDETTPVRLNFVARGRPGFCETTVVVEEE